MSYTIGISTKGNPEQAEFARLIHQNDKPIIYCTGNAGTGKTIVALAAAIKLLDDKKYQKIIYVREPIEVGGTSLGYLKGDLEEKFSPYLGPLTDNLEQLCNLTHRNFNDLMHKIETMPPAYLRGHSFPPGTIILADEAQNFSRIEIKTLLTRLGKYCKAILIGSTNQIDRRGMDKDNNEFMKTYEILKDQPFIGYVHLIKSERSDFCSIIDELL